MFNRTSLSIAVLLTFLAATGGFFVGKSTIPVPQVPKDQPLTSIIKSDPIFQKYLASFQGEVVEVTGGKIEVKNTQGKTGKFTVHPDIVITDPDPSKPGTASRSASLNTLEIGRQAFISALWANGEFQINAVQYFKR